ncbi:MAG: hypothetical protein HC831_21665 [Chloroflexia bacterium]|nr:hypothetical protein [Chloroflexia bacterium]
MYLSIFLIGMGAGAFAYEKLFVKECPPQQVQIIEQNIKAKKGSTVSDSDISDVRTDQQSDEVKVKKNRGFLGIGKKKDD